MLPFDRKVYVNLCLFPPILCWSDGKLVSIDSQPTGVRAQNSAKEQQITIMVWFLSGNESNVCAAKPKNSKQLLLPAEICGDERKKNCPSFHNIHKFTSASNKEQEKKKRSSPFYSASTDLISVARFCNSKHSTFDEVAVAF